MCGIVGVLGNHEAAPILVEALKRLEYRGYDSAGIATLQDSRLDRRRAALDRCAALLTRKIDRYDHLMKDTPCAFSSIFCTRRMCIFSGTPFLNSLPAATRCAFSRARKT